MVNWATLFNIYHKGSFAYGEGFHEVASGHGGNLQPRKHPGPLSGRLTGMTNVSAATAQASGAFRQIRWRTS